MRLAGPRCLVDRRQADRAHQPPDTLAADAPALAAQVPRHLTRAIPGRFHEGPVDDTHQLKILRALASGLAVERGSRDRDQLALATDREPFVIGINHHSPPIQAQRSKALAKKSRSTTSWPILACSFVTSASRPTCASEALSSNALARFSMACRFHCVIWLG